MKTHIDCVPCFFEQAIDAARRAGAGPAAQKEILKRLGGEIKKFSFDRNPPEMGRILYRMVMAVTGHRDPFKKIKKKSNAFVLGMYDDLKAVVAGSSDRLLKAVELSIIGNSIDYGAGKSFNAEKEVRKILAKDFDFHYKEKRRAFDYRHFVRRLDRARRVLYIGDNAGEIVFDRILIEEINRRWHDRKRITFSVRGGPVINDITREDASVCGLHACARVISSGYDMPGILLARSSRDFVREYRAADMIISKGQGNFESLPDGNKRIFYLFRVKCPVVAAMIGCPVGNCILKQK